LGRDRRAGACPPVLGGPRPGHDPARQRAGRGPESRPQAWRLGEGQDRRAPMGEPTMSAGSFVRLSVMFVLGAMLGIWTFVEPWVIHYPFGVRHEWSSSTWANVWVGGIVTAASLVALVVVVAVGLRRA